MLESQEQIRSYTGANKLIWNGYANDDLDDITSVLRLVDENAETLRSRYLNYIYTLGATVYKGQTVVEHLQLRTSMSFWWKTLIAEKNNYGKSNCIDDLIKLLALEKFVSENRPCCIKLVSGNKSLAKVLNLWSRDQRIDFVWINPKNQKTHVRFNWRLLIGHLPLLLQGCLWLATYLPRAQKLRGLGVAKWERSKAKTMLISYFSNLVEEKAYSGFYESFYWGRLPKIFRSNYTPIKILHIWVNGVLSKTNAKTIITRMNENTQTKQDHVLLDSFFDFEVLRRTLIDWVVLMWRSRGLDKVLAEKKCGDFDFWSLLKDDWYKSIRGKEAVKSILISNLLDRAVGTSCQQTLGFYLQENQPWEIGLISSWKARNFGTLIGVPHSTIPYWYLPYYNDARSYSDPAHLRLPVPDLVAVNGPVARQRYLECGYPVDRLVDVEALRYEHLNQFSKNKKSVPKKSLIIMTDYLSENTYKQLKLFEKISDNLTDWKVTLKPHPLTTVELSDFQSLKGLSIEISTKPLEILLREHQVAYTSLVTSAAVEAYSSGLNVVSFADCTCLNLSPLNGLSGVSFVSTPDALEKSLFIGINKRSAEDYFFSSTDLRRWRDVIKVFGDRH